MNAQRFGLNVLTAVVTALVAGCVSAPTKRANNGAAKICPACIRDAGVIGVVATSTIPKFTVQLPMTQQQAVNAWRQRVTHGFCSDENQSSFDECDQFLIEGTLGLGLGWVVAGSLIGQTVGNSTAVSPERLHVADLTLHKAVAELDLQESVRRSVVALSATERQHPVRLVTKPFPPGQEAEYSQMAGVMCATLAWLPHGQTTTQYLTAQGVDTVLEIQLIHPGLVGNGGVNPQLRVELDGRARLVSVREGRELANIPLRYRGEGRKFTAWAAADARAFHAEIEHCGDALAAQCVAAFFPPETVATVHTASCRRPTPASQ